MGQRAAILENAVDILDRDQFRKALPHLATRIFALQGETYDGSGFHWSMVKQIGGLLERANNLDVTYTPAQLVLDTELFCDLVDRCVRAEHKVELHEMVQNWLNVWVQPRIDAGEQSIRVAPPTDAEVWEHHKEDNFYRELDTILRPLGFLAVAAKPVKGEPSHVTLVFAQGQ